MTPGPMVDSDGAQVGTHRGIGAYTVGQRKGLGLAAAEPTFVARIDPARNLLVVGPERLLYTHTVTADKVHLTSVERLEAGMRVQGKIRSRAEAASAVVEAWTGDTFTVRFADAQRAVTPGQAIVLYDGEIVLGGGTIASAA
jgi:tRNA-specific 2-thiouridylase